LKHMRIIFVAVVLVFALVPFFALGAPDVTDVSGTVEHGQNIIIFGTSFGTKSPAKPYVWADFEQGNLNPSSLGTVTSWDPYEIRPENTYFNSGCPAGIGCLGYTFPGNAQHRTGMTVDVPDGIDYPGRKIIQFRKVKLTGWNVEELVGGLYWNVKGPIRAWPSDQSGCSGECPNLFIRAGGAPSENTQFGVEYCNTPSRDGQSCIQNSLVTDFIYPDGTVVSDEFRLKASSHTDKDGSVYWKVGSLTMFNDVAVCTSCATPGGHPYTPMDKPSIGRIGNDQSGHYVPAGATFVEDDIYFDLTWSRVMLCNNAAYDSATICEPQIPSAWVDGSATVKVNLGQLPDTGTAYLFVFDADNNHNATGYSVTLGGALDVTPPAAPSGLSVQ
jgi:hypothetical protein